MLSEDRSLNPEQDDFALQLRQLAPSHRLDRATLLYRAGYEAGRQIPLWRQRWLTAAALLMSCTTAMLWLDRYQPESGDALPLASHPPAPVAAALSPPVVVPASPVETRIERPPYRPHPSSYLALRRFDRREPELPHGVSDGTVLPSPQSTRWQLERELLPPRPAL